MCYILSATIVIVLMEVFRRMMWKQIGAKLKDILRNIFKCIPSCISWESTIVVQHIRVVTQLPPSLLRLSLSVFPQLPGGSWLTTSSRIHRVTSSAYTVTRTETHWHTNPPTRTHKYIHTTHARRGIQKAAFENARTQTMPSSSILQQHLLMVHCLRLLIIVPL